MIFTIIDQVDATFVVKALINFLERYGVLGLQLLVYSWRMTMMRIVVLCIYKIYDQFIRIAI